MRKILTTATIFLSIAICLSARTVRPDSLGRGTGAFSNPALLLQGMVSGVRVASTDGNPSGAVSTRIRGLNSVRGVSEPLWIVDGAILTSSTGQTSQPFQQYGDYAYLAEISQMEGWNLYDIESIEVLKNTSATALYGARGANGVVIIKTKMPSSDKFSRVVHTNAGISAPTVTGEGLRPGFSHNHSLALGSSSGRTRYRFSAFYRDFQGVTDKNGSQAVGLRTMFETRANKTVWFGLNASLSLANAASRTGAAWYGAPSQTLSLRGIEPLAYNDAAGTTSLQGWERDFDDDSRIVRTTDNFFLTLNFTPSLSLNNTVSFDMQDNSRYIWYGNGTAFGKDYNGAAGITYASLFTLDLKSELNWHRYFGKHLVNFLGAVEYCADWNKFNTMSGTNFFMHDLRAKGLNLKESKTYIRYFPKNLGSLGGHAKLEYAFSGKGGIDIAAKYETVERYDSGSPFTDNFYPAANAWLDLRGIFLPDSESISTLRLEGGYGKAGRRRYIPYEMLGAFTGGYYPAVETDFQAFYEAYNRITTSEYNAGVKVGTLGDRLTLSAGWYDRSTVDRLTLYCFGEPHPRKEGIWRSCDRKEAHDQASTIANRGFEWDLSFKGGKALKWALGLNGAYNVNRLLEVDSSDSRGYILNQYDMFATRNVAGYAVSSIWGFTLDGSNTVTGEDVLGETVPKFTGGISATLEWHGVKLEAEGYAATGFNILNMNRMQASGEEYVAAAFVEKGDYFRLGRATLAYTIPLKGGKIESLDVHVTGTNLLTLTGYSGWNPEVSSFGFTNLAGGIDYGSYPLARMIMIGVSAKF